MRITRKFKQLTRNTYPFGTERYLERHLPNGFVMDNFGNYYLMIGDSPSTMFACHLDTACSTKEKVIHVEENDYIGTDGTTILGADDKAGMVVLLYMIEKRIPGLYYFFIGEEVGCVGSSMLSNYWFDTGFSNHITKVISFDRRGIDSVITEQLFGRCCSDDFAFALCDSFNSTNLGLDFYPDPTGIFTDSAKFMDIVPECTNISVGYYNEHTGGEIQDMGFLRNLCKAVCLVDWENLPVVRDPYAEMEYISDDDDDDDDDDEFFKNINSHDVLGFGLTIISDEDFDNDDDSLTDFD